MVTYRISRRIRRTFFLKNGVPNSPCVLYADSGGNNPKKSLEMGSGAWSPIRIEAPNVAGASTAWFLCFVAYTAMSALCLMLYQHFLCIFACGCSSEVILINFASFVDSLSARRNLS